MELYRPKQQEVDDAITATLSPFQKKYDLTVTGTGWTTYNAVGLPYQTEDGSWRLKFNIRGLAFGSVQTYVATVTGIEIDEGHAFTVFSGSAYSMDGVSVIASNGFQMSSTGAVNWGTFTTHLSGDIPLAGKPAFVI